MAIALVECASSQDVPDNLPRGQRVYCDQQSTRLPARPIDDAPRVRALKACARHAQAKPWTSSTMRSKPPLFAFGPSVPIVVMVPRRVPLACRGSRDPPRRRRTAITPAQRYNLRGSHRSDQEEFYQLLAHKDHIAVEAKLAEREHFCSYARPHGAFNDETPYSAPRERPLSKRQSFAISIGKR